MSAFYDSFTEDDCAARGRGQVFCTRSVPPRESLEFWHDAVFATLVGMDIRTEGGTYDATMRTDRLGDLRITTVDCDPGEVHRDARRVARGDGTEVFVAVQASGTAQVEQDGRYTELRPGDIAFFETVRPYRTRFPQRFQLKIFAVPRRLLGQPEEALGRITAQAVRPRGGLAALLSPFMSRLADTSESYSGPVADRIAESAVGLLAATAAEQLGEEPAELPGAERVLLLRVQRYVRWNLADPALTPAVIARAHGISVRYLHRLFEQEGTTVGRWIRGLRLQECRRELTDAAGLGGVARRWGFSGTAHFARAFRREYGTSPTDWLLAERDRRCLEAS
ncbi:AraC-like ligand-binding domain-containing protein [Streptomyces justiciae]|uniref:AraC-like ligand-binding domain-containing protein n=1 Tax=Streptomyces justiciae TaxID=2780140 RepID=UPI001881AB91|nr:helix-turn-helix domain-containing protein [Streptomyces justiciae]MBE8472053.1 helix-turn-helix domain-containing protein [Streptomyces justiciae]